MTRTLTPMELDRPRYQPHWDACRGCGTPTPYTDLFYKVGTKHVRANLRCWDCAKDDAWSLGYLAWRSDPKPTREEVMVKDAPDDTK
jgi:hypothetical protein